MVVYNTRGAQFTNPTVNNIHSADVGFPYSYGSNTGRERYFGWGWRREQWLLKEEKNPSRFK